MMLTLFAATAFAYTLPTKPLSYQVDIEFDGFLPVLGGNEGKVSTSVTMSVNGKEADGDGNPQVVSDLTDLKVVWNGEKMPFGVDNVRAYFPKTTISITPLGKVVKTDAPDVKLPVRLPGLDVKRFPEITYIPVEFPIEGIEVGKSFSYQKPFGDSMVTYQVTPTLIDGATLKLALTLKQSYKNMVDSSWNVVEKKEDAEAEVTTEVNGSGEAIFDAGLGILKENRIVAESVSVSKPLKEGEASTKKLKTTMVVKLKP